MGQGVAHQRCSTAPTNTASSTHGRRNCQMMRSSAGVHIRVTRPAQDGPPRFTRCARPAPRPRPPTPPAASWLPPASRGQPATSKSLPATSADRPTLAGAGLERGQAPPSNPLWQQTWTSWAASGQRASKGLRRSPDGPEGMSPGERPKGHGGVGGTSSPGHWVERRRPSRVTS